MNMKFSELLELIDDYTEAKWSPSRSEVRLGCDCGCGGDSYTIESWDAVEKAADKAIADIKEFCKKYNIEYDGVE